MTQVAAAFGQPFMAVWRAPYHETLLAFVGLADRRRIDALEAWARDVRAAYRVNAAFANPKDLEKEQQQVFAALRRSGTPAPPLSKDDALAMAARAVASVTHGD